MASIVEETYKKWKAGGFEKPKPFVYVAHGSRMSDGKHTVSWGTGSERKFKKFDDFQEAMVYGFSKGKEMGLSSGRIKVSGPGHEGSLEKKPSALSRFVQVIKPHAKEGAKVTARIIKASAPHIKTGAKITAKAAKAVDRWLTNEPPPRRRKRKAKKGLYAANSGGAHLVSRKPFKGANRIKAKRRNRKR